MHHLSMCMIIIKSKVTIAFKLYIREKDTRTAYTDSFSVNIYFNELLYQRFLYASVNDIFIHTITVFFHE